MYVFIEQLILFVLIAGAYLWQVRRVKRADARATAAHMTAAAEIIAPTATGVEVDAMHATATGPGPVVLTLRALAFAFNTSFVTYLVSVFLVKKPFFYQWPHSARFYIYLAGLTALIAVILLAARWLIVKSGANRRARRGVTTPADNAYTVAAAADAVNAAAAAQASQVADATGAAGAVTLNSAATGTAGAPSPQDMLPTTSGAPTTNFVKNQKPDLDRITPLQVVVRILLSIVGAVLGLLAGVMIFVPWWFHHYFGTVTADQFVFLVIGNQNGDSTPEATANVTNYMVVPAIATTIVGMQLGLWYRTIKTKALATTAYLLIVALAVPWSLHYLPLTDLYKQEISRSSLFEDRYVDPNLSVHMPEQKRNLIHIYMESMENSFYDKAHGGYDENNLMPDLMVLNGENPHFSNRADTFGGPHQTYGAVHSLAGMVNMESGIPMKTSVSGGEANMVYPKFSTIGQLLEKEGYTNEIMLGADASWGGLDHYYTEHGNFKIFDVRYARDNGYIPQDYNVWWGYEDDKIYEFAKSELTRLGSGDKPFYFILENADTHFPDGYVSPNMEDAPFEKQYANVIHYSQKEVVKFVQWAQQQPWYENTTIVITGDHQSMDKNFFEGWDPSYERTVVNMYINSVAQPKSESVQFNRQYAPFDFFPTTLAAIGATMDDNRAGLGRNLFSGEPTLIEELGLSEVNAGLAAKTPFYFDYDPAVPHVAGTKYEPHGHGGPGGPDGRPGRPGGPGGPGDPGASPVPGGQEGDSPSTSAAPAASASA